MALVVTREDFVGKYDGVTPSILLKPGQISDGLNVRKVSQLGGWKPRKGYALHNTTAAESGAAIKSLHQFVHPYNGDYNFIAQVNSKLLKASNNPPSAGTTFGQDLGVSVGTTPGFSCLVNDKWCYADGSGPPIVYAGTGPFPMAVFSYHHSTTAYVDFTREIIDNRTATYAQIFKETTNKLYILTYERISGISVTLGTNKNTASSTLTVKAMRSGTWTTVSSLSDGTASSGATLAQTGTISWTGSSSDTLFVIGNVMGYAYELSWDTELSNTVQVTSIKCTMPASTITNKWNGKFEWINGALFYANSSGTYIESLGKLTNESDALYLDLSSATTSDYLYIKTVEPACGFGFGIATGYANSEAATINSISYWNGSAWSSLTITDDTTKNSAGTSSFAQTGRVFFNAEGATPVKRTFQSDKVPGYWYRIGWSATLGSSVRLYAALYAAQPEALPAYSGCVEFKGRLFLWGDAQYKNRLRYSAYDRYDCFSGTDSGYTDAFGGSDAILCAVKFYNELVVFKKTGIYLLEGYSPSTFGILKLADTVGIASPKTAHSIEIGYSGMHADEVINVVIWQDVDGVYVLDGRKPKKISSAVDHFFNPEYTSTCISATYITSLQAFVDYFNNEYHLLTPSYELVYNYATDEWYPPWSRTIPLTTGAVIRGTDDRYYTYGASTSGFVLKLESGTHDKNTSDESVAIPHSIKTRAIQALVSDDMGRLYFSPSLRFAINGAKILAKAQTSGQITVKAYYDMSSSATVLTSSGSLINSGYAMAVVDVPVSANNLVCVEFEIYTSSSGVEAEIWSINFGTEVTGRIN